MASNKLSCVKQLCRLIILACFDQTLCHYKKDKGVSIMNILVIDAQGGGIGRQLVTAIREKMAEADITAVGTNTVATAAMLKAGADNAATGENAVVVNTRRADVIVGPIGIVIADAMFGEITPRMANAVAQSSACLLYTSPSPRD